MCNEVRKHNKFRWYGHGTTFMMNLLGAKFCSWYVMKAKIKNCFNDSIKVLEEVNPDVVVSSHWANNYYAENMNKKPITIIYSPDVIITNMFAFKSDLVITPVKKGYDIAMKNKKRFNNENLKLVNTAIRNEAFDVELDKVKQRKALGLDPDKFTVCLTDGGYGIGRIKEITLECIKRNLPINIIAVTGKNEKLYNELSNLRNEGQTKVLVVPFVPNILNHIAASDLFCGKSGANAIAEAVFFGVPIIIDNTVTCIENNNAKYYVNDAKCALLIRNEKKIVNKIEEFIKNKSSYDELHKNALKLHENFGAEKAADEIYNFIKKQK